MNTAIVKLVNCLVESVSIDVIPIFLKLFIQLSELVLDGLGLAFELLVIVSVLRFAIKAKLDISLDFFGHGCFPAFPVDAYRLTSFRIDSEEMLLEIAHSEEVCGEMCCCKRLVPDVVHSDARLL